MLTQKQRDLIARKIKWKDRWEDLRDWELTELQRAVDDLKRYNTPTVTVKAPVPRGKRPPPPAVNVSAEGKLGGGSFAERWRRHRAAQTASETGILPVEADTFTDCPWNES